MKTYSTLSNSSVKQKGAILIFALILLTVLSLVGVSANRDIILQERMTGNELDSTVALNAAETALREAQTTLGNCAPREIDYYGNVDGLYDISANPAPDWAVAAKLPDNDSTWIAHVLDKVGQNPRYTVERLEPISLTTDQDLQLGQPVQSAVPFSIVSQGFGRGVKTDAVVEIIQYTYNCAG